MRISRQGGRGLRRFEEIELGTVFEYDNVVYIRAMLDSDGGKRKDNAVCLLTGLGAHITDDLCVLPLDAELVIR